MANEKRLIDANQFRGKQKIAEVNGKLSSVVLYTDIAEAPTVDAAGVPQGYWEKVGRISVGGLTEPMQFYKCSCCREGDFAQSKHCPNCGAKMDGGNENG